MTIEASRPRAWIKIFFREGPAAEAERRQRRELLTRLLASEHEAPPSAAMMAANRERPGQRATD